jgi:tungstate transport system substrate-binding protein
MTRAMKTAVAAAVLTVAVASCRRDTEPQRLLLGSTHTLEDSGVLDTLVTAFKSEHPDVALSSVIGSSGEILTMAARGDFDVIFTHSPADEEAFIAAGNGTDRKPVMHNDFIIVGPPEDSAHVADAADAAQSVKRVKEAGAMFISRGDDSGTHRKELQLWKDARTEPAWDGYVEAGTGMSDALRLASQRRAYVMADRATFEMLRDELDLEILHEGDPRLLNEYSVTLVARAANAEGARVFADWLTGAAARAIISEFGKAKTGKPLFTPDTK